VGRLCDGRGTGVGAHAAVRAGADEEEEGDEETDLRLGERRGFIFAGGGEDGRDPGAREAGAEEGGQEGQQPDFQRRDEGARLLPFPDGVEGARACFGDVGLLC